MSTRATRSIGSGTATPIQQEKSLTNRERLLLAQVVYKLGSDAWSQAAKLLSNHPLISRPKSFFTPQSCNAMYTLLMNEAGLACTDECHAPNASVHLKLAQRHYQTRRTELREQIAAEEAKFKALVTELDDIRSGLWDDKIFAAAGGILDSKQFSAEDIETVPANVTPTDEVFGSDLSGVTDSGSPPTHRPDEGADRKDGGPIPGHNTLEKGDNRFATQTVVSPLEGTPTAVVQDMILPRDVPTGDMKTMKATITTDDDLAEEVADVTNSAGLNVIHVDVDVRASDDLTLEISECGSPIEAAEANDDVTVSNETPKIDEERNSEHPTEDRLRQRSPSEGHGAQDIEAIVPFEKVQEPEILQEKVEKKVELKVKMPDADDDDDSSSGEEPLQMTHRAIRRRASSASSVVPSNPRGRPRRALDNLIKKVSRASREIEQSPMDVDIEREQSIPEVDERSKTSTPKVEEEVASGFDNLTSRRREGKRKASAVEFENPRDKKRNREDSEPAEEDSGPTAGSSRMAGRRRNENPVALKRFQYVIGMLHSQISQHRSGTIFHHPIKANEAPDYRDIVKRPIDLKTIKAKIKDGSIANSQEFQRDIFLMFANAMMYNRPGSDIYNMAEDMMLESEGFIYTFQQTEGFVRGAQRT